MSLFKFPWKLTSKATDEGNRGKIALTAISGK